MGAKGTAPAESGPLGEAREGSTGFTITNAVGRVVSSGNGLARTYVGYDARGRTIATDHVLDGVAYTYTFKYGFPCAGSACTAPQVATNGSVIVSEAFPDNEFVSYTFDAGDTRQKTTTQPPSGAVETIVSSVTR